MASIDSLGTQMPTPRTFVKSTADRTSQPGARAALHKITRFEVRSANAQVQTEHERHKLVCFLFEVQPVACELVCAINMKLQRVAQVHQLTQGLQPRWILLQDERVAGISVEFVGRQRCNFARCVALTSSSASKFIANFDVSVAKEFSFLSILQCHLAT